MKQELKHQQRPTQKPNRKRWLVALLLIVIGGVLLVSVYRQQQLEAPQRLLAKGIKLESRGKVVAAEAVYGEIYKKYPDSENAAEALLKIARIEEFDRKNARQALLNYLQLEHDYPASPLVLPAREAAAGIVKFTLRDYSRAIEYYSRLLELNSTAADRYYYEIADCYFRLKNYPQARIEFGTLVEEYPASPLAAEALYRRAGLFLLEGDNSAATKEWERLVSDYPTSPFRSMAEIDLAKQLEEDGFLEAALSRYEELAAGKKSVVLNEKITRLQERIAKKKGAL